MPLFEGHDTYNPMWFSRPLSSPTRPALQNRLPWPFTDVNSPIRISFTSESPSTNIRSLPVSPYAVRTLGLPPSLSGDWKSIMFHSCVCERCIYDADPRDQQSIQHRYRQLLNLRDKLGQFARHTAQNPGDSIGTKKLKAGLTLDLAYYAQDESTQQLELDSVRTVCRAEYASGWEGMRQIDLKEGRGSMMTEAITRRMEVGDYSIGPCQEMHREIQDGMLSATNRDIARNRAQLDAPLSSRQTPQSVWPLPFMAGPSDVPLRTGGDELTNFIQSFPHEVQNQIVSLASPNHSGPTEPERTPPLSPPLGYMTEDGALIIPEADVLANLQTIEDYVLRNGIRYLIFQGNETNEAKRLIGAWCVEMERHEVYVCSEDM